MKARIGRLERLWPRYPSPDSPLTPGDKRFLQQIVMIYGGTLPEFRSRGEMDRAFEAAIAEVYGPEAVTGER